MTELTKAEMEAIISGPGFWGRMQNKWYNFSWLWSSKERRLQKALQDLHDDIGDNIGLRGGPDLMNHDFNKLTTPDDDFYVKGDN